MSRVELHIDSLVVRGLPWIDGAALAESLQQALAARLPAMGAPTAATTHRAEAAIDLPDHVGTLQLSEALAGAITDLVGSRADSPRTPSERPIERKGGSRDA